MGNHILLDIPRQTQYLMAKLKTSNIDYHCKRIVTRTIYYLENCTYLKENIFCRKKLLILP